MTVAAFKLVPIEILVIQVEHDPSTVKLEVLPVCVFNLKFKLVT